MFHNPGLQVGEEAYDFEKGSTMVVDSVNGPEVGQGDGSGV